MYILTLRTDKPDAEIGLYVDGNRLEYQTWSAHRQLAETIHTKLVALLALRQLQLRDVEAILCYAGPGSFTGLRIGLTVANALAYSLECPIIAVEGEDWLQIGLSKLQKGDSDAVALPEYGAEVNITRPKA